MEHKMGNETATGVLSGLTLVTKGSCGMKKGMEKEMETR